MTSLDGGLVLLRLVVGLLFVGHGAQKLFGWWSGRGLASHQAFLETLNFRPARVWAVISALSEFLGGLGLALGLLTPLAAPTLIGSMLVAIFKVHWRHGVWSMEGGYEYALVLATTAFFVGLVGPGAYSLDAALGLTWLHPYIYWPVLAVMLIVVVVGMLGSTLASNSRA